MTRTFRRSIFLQCWSAFWYCESADIWSQSIPQPKISTGDGGNGEAEFPGAWEFLDSLFTSYFLALHHTRGTVLYKRYCS